MVNPEGAPAGTEPREPVDERRTLAAVDLGSNSFHMVIAQLVDGRPVIVDRLREQVQLAAGLTGRGELSADAQARAIACLEQFGQRVRQLPAEQVRAVGTNTLRVARRTRAFVDAASRTLGHEIEVISGLEEARLIYLGVAHDLAFDGSRRRLVVDIGGGSTECIVGEAFEPIEAHSLYMGCVGYSREFFPDGVIKRKAFDAAVLAARLELQPACQPLRELGWHEAVGSSGTIRTAEAVLHLNGWSPQGITGEGLARLRRAMLDARHVDAFDFEGLEPQRRSIIAGGVAILIAIFESLGVERMTTASGALREGVLHDLIGRIRDEDIRQRTITTFQDRYDVDKQQAARVERTALALLDRVAASWELDLGEAREFLRWAAQLHEIGLALSYPHHHEHGEYLIANSEMPGLSRDDQHLLAAIVGRHRRKVGRDRVDTISSPRLALAVRLIALLRLAVLLNRGRRSGDSIPYDVEADGDRLILRFEAGWLAAHPLTRTDLGHEIRPFRELGWKLRIDDRAR